MKIELSSEQTLLKDSIERLFREESTSERVRAAEETGLDRNLWGKLHPLGFVSMRDLSTEEGGASLLDAVIMAEAAGKYLASAPVVEALIASSVLHQLKAPADLLAALADGAITTLALQPLTQGRAQFIPSGAVAEIVIAMDEGELVAFKMSGGLPRANDIAASGGSFVARDAFENSERTVIATGEAAARAYAIARLEWELLTAASLVGIGRQALELAAAYSVERVQFGKPIGSFQGIAHPLANAATQLDGARLLIWRAVWELSQETQDAPGLASMAFCYAQQAVDPAVSHAVRTFGGYGVSLEYDVQLYFRRAKLLSLVCGGSGKSLDRVAERLWGEDVFHAPDVGDTQLDFGFGDKALAYAASLRAFIEENMTPEVQAKVHHSTAGYHPEFHKKLAQAGHSFSELLDDETLRRSRYEVMAATPIWEELNWTRTPQGVSLFVGKMCKLWSQPEAKAEILSGMINGDALGCLGFSEPGSGSDVFSARFNAARDGEDWVLNGQKMFTTNAHNADYILLLTRTDNSGKKHQGLTMFIAPLRVPGVEIQPVHTLQDERTNIVFFSDVKLSDKYRLGEVGDGARVMASALGFEHNGAVYHAAQSAMIKHAVNWAKKPGPDGEPRLNDPDVRRAVAQAAMNDQVAECLARREIWADAEDRRDPSFGPMSKLFTTETMYQDASAIVEAAATESPVRGVDHDLDIIEVTMRRAIAMTLYGGTSEVHRSLIAENSLGMPKSRG